MQTTRCDKEKICVKEKEKAIKSAATLRRESANGICAAVSRKTGTICRVTAFGASEERRREKATGGVCYAYNMERHKDQNCVTNKTGAAVWIVIREFSLSLTHSHPFSFSLRFCLYMLLEAFLVVVSFLISHDRHILNPQRYEQQAKVDVSRFNVNLDYCKFIDWPLTSQTRYKRQ